MIGTEGWDDENTSDGDGWNQNQSGLWSGPPNSFWIYIIFISSGFEELELFLLEIDSPESAPDLSRSRSTVWGDGLRAR